MPIQMGIFTQKLPDLLEKLRGSPEDLVSRFTQIFTAAQLLFVLLLPAFLMEEHYAFFHAKYESYLQNV